MDQTQNYKEKYERAKLHTRYLWIIAGILAVIGISIALGGCSEALGQISMASTVSSIILSSIAIFMSISGENKLNYTHDRLVETSDRMSEITGHIEKANSMLDSTINQKLVRIDDIFDRLEQIGQSVGNVEKKMFNKSLSINKNSIVDISDDILWQIYISTLEELDDNTKILVEAIVEYVIVCYSTTHAAVGTDKISEYILSKVKDEDSNDLDMAYGIVWVFISIGIMEGETLMYFEEKIKISEEKQAEIKKFL